MIRRWLAIDPDAELVWTEWGMRSAWPAWLRLALLVLAAAYGVWLYRARPRPAGRWGGVLAGLRIAAMMLLVLALFEPVLRVEFNELIRRQVPVLIDLSESMTVQDLDTPGAATPETARDWARAAGLARFDGTGELPPRVQERVRELTRLDLARGIIRHEELALGETLGAAYSLRFFRFGERLEALPEPADAFEAALDALQADASLTRLGDAVDAAAEQMGGRPVAGIVLLTDGGSNDGLDAVEVAERMGAAGIPIYPVGIGLPDAPDVAVRGLMVSETVFVRDRVRVGFQLDATGFEGHVAQVRMELDGREVAREAIRLEGRAQYARLYFVPDRPREATELVVRVEPLAGESNLENNEVRQTVRILDDRIQVLYIEGRPRWEFRYLRGVLLRDHRLDVRFLMTEGDRELAAASERYLASYPIAAEEAFSYDLVILGDVPATFFSRAQLERMAEAVRDRGAALLMLAGREHAPGSYTGTPIEAVLPVRLRLARWEPLSEEIHPVVTPDGRRNDMVMVDYPEENNDALWQRVRPLFGVPGVEGAKPGATVLLGLSDAHRRREPYPLVAWQRYGSGRAMYVGTDQLWRLRFMRGDVHHARFWGQAIQFLTLSRLLGEDRRVQIETDRSRYRTGERVEILATVLNEAFEPVRTPSYRVRVEALDAPGESAMFDLASVPDTPGLFRGALGTETAGRFRVQADGPDREQAREPVFEVEAVALEWLDTSMRRDLLIQMAERSGGRYFDLADLPDLAGAFSGEPRTVRVRVERTLFDRPWLLGLLLAFLGAEWFLRRRLHLL